MNASNENIGPTASQIELFAMQMWQNETGEVYGWGSVPETQEYRVRAKNFLENIINIAIPFSVTNV